MGLIRLFTRKKHYLLAALVIALVVWGVYYLWATRDAGKAAGIYMTGDGAGYVVIERSLIPGQLRVTEGMLSSYPDLSKHDKSPVIKASFRNGKLRLFQETRFQPSIAFGSDMKYSTSLKLTLFPSGKSNLDWGVNDARFDMAIPQRGQTPLFSHEFWQDITSSSSWDDFNHRMARYHKNNYSLSLRPDHDPMPHFLYRIDDPRIVDYMRKRLQRPSTTQELNLMRKIIADHPDDPWLIMHLIELETDLGDLGKAEAYAKQWRTSQANQNDILMWETYERVYKHILYAIVQRDYPDLESIKDKYAPSVSPTLSLQAYLDWFRKLAHFDGMLIEPQPLVKAIYDPLYENQYVSPNYFSIQISAKAARVFSQFNLISGDRQDSLNLLSGMFRLGQSMSADGINLNRLHGWILRRESSKGFEILVLNACETPEEIRAVRQRLSWLEHVPIRAKPESLFNDIEPGLMHQLDLSVFSTYKNNQEPITRTRVADALWKNVLMGAAVKEYFLMTGGFPQSHDQIERLFEDKIPSDPFDDEANPIRFIAEPDECIVYSIGPDNVDDFASNEYDSSNGTISTGDILMRIPREREYPFPREGVHAATAADLQRQFPNGLPADPFRRDVHEYPLSVVDCDGKQPVRIYSYGPNDQDDQAQMEFDYLKGYRSQGDLIFSVPE